MVHISPKHGLCLHLHQITGVRRLRHALTMLSNASRELGGNLFNDVQIAHNHSLVDKETVVVDVVLLDKLGKLVGFLRVVEWIQVHDLVPRPSIN
jgi:hypothetical protein